MPHTPTPEQSSIIEFMATSRRNLLVDALAGAAKTSTLVMVCEAVPRHTLSIAFNKRIAEELATRMPPHVECRTLNSIGHRAWSRFINKRLTLDTKKRFNILSELIKELPSAEQEPLFAAFSDLLRAMTYGAECGWIPAGVSKHARPLIGDDEIIDRIGNQEWGWDLSRVEQHILFRGAEIAAEQAISGHIDFADQILMPTIFPASFDRYELVLVDEAQDLSALNHRMVRKIAAGARLMAVGDPCQAIYGFRGAHQNSMDLLREQFEMETLGLTVSFRCAREVAEHVRWRAPLIQSPEWAEDGTVSTLTMWNPDTLPPAAAIICRNNAPLFSTAMRLLRSGRRPQIIGNDITKGLIKDLKKLGKPTLPRDAMLEALAKHATGLRLRYKDSAFINDKIACLEHFCADAESLGIAIASAERVLTATGPIQLMTGHKSKGLEFDDVFFLDEHLINRERGGQQEDNLRYVIATRAKRNLTYVTSSGWVGEE